MSFEIAFLPLMVIAPRVVTSRVSQDVESAVFKTPPASPAIIPCSSKHRFLSGCLFLPFLSPRIVLLCAALVM